MGKVAAVGEVHAEDGVAGLKSGEWIILLGTKQAPEIGGEVKPAQ